MASRLEQELTCPICRGHFRDPVVLCCSHNFCRVCLQTWWEDKPIKTCPFCKRRSKRYRNDDPPENLALKNIVEAYNQQMASEPECSLHSEKLRLFCLDHWEPICLVCRDSTAHKDHRFMPIQEAALDRREQQRRNMEPLQDILKELNERRVQFDDAKAHILTQYEDTKEKIREQYQQMHLCLYEEEFAKKKALREEKEQKIQKMKDKMEAVSRDIETVSKTISETEEQLKAGDASFLLSTRLQ
uniref:Uncharacterized protein n=1 Tax=Neogobius melanostomus TaxID=47308 RepID=A0A8C6S9E8_9GOBI